MSLHPRNSALISQGWIRALLLLIVYTTLSVAAGFITGSLQVWLVLSFVISLTVVYLFRTYIDRKNFSQIGLQYKELFPDALIGFLLGTVLICAGSVILVMLKGIEWVDRSFNANDMFVSMLLLLLAALGEELVFRGYILRNLMKSFNKWIALLASALLFTLVHAANGDTPLTGMLNIFLGGLLTGICFIITRSLWLPVFFHFSWNFVQGPVLGFPVTGFPFNSLLVMELTGHPLLTGGDFGFEASLVCSGLLVLTFLCTCIFDKKKSHAMMNT